MNRRRFDLVHEDDFQRSGRRLLARRSPGLASFGLDLVEIEPGAAIPEHDETVRDQEEVDVVPSGNAEAVVDGERDAAPAGTDVRVDPEPRRTIVNVGDEPVRLLMVSAPTASGYEPMDWAWDPPVRPSGDGADRRPG